MNIPSYKTFRNISSALACAVFFTACASSGAPTALEQTKPPVQNTQEYVQAADFYYTVERGDLLTEIAPLPVSAAIRVPATRNNIDDSGPDSATVQVAKANPNKRFVLRPLGSDVSGDSAAMKIENDHIKIIGSYFPKVVYRAPQLNAKQLMRVAPGTTFPLEKLADGWYQISTEQGPGYLRLEDGKPTNAKS